MATFSDTAKDIYFKVVDVIENNATFSYFKTKQPGFYPRESNLTSPSMYPWVFCEFGNITEEGLFRYPHVWEYEFVMSVIGLTFADKGRPEDLVFSTDLNDNPGIGDIALDFRSVFGEKKRKPGWGISGIQDWGIVRTGTPTTLMIQSLLTHEYIRGIQCDLSFKIIDRL